MYDVSLWCKISSVGESRYAMDDFTDFSFVSYEKCMLL